MLAEIEFNLPFSSIQFSLYFFLSFHTFLLLKNRFHSILFSFNSILFISFHFFDWFSPIQSLSLSRIYFVYFLSIENSLVLVLRNESIDGEDGGEDCGKGGGENGVFSQSENR